MSRESMIRQAERSLGWGEPNPVHEWYGDRNGSYFGRGSTPWCDMAVTYWAHRADEYDAVCMGTDYAYTVWHAQAFQRQGRWHTNTRGIRRGDIVFFDWGGTNQVGRIDHVGIVTGVSGGAVYTIEGNTSNRCARRVRYAGSIAGYGRPDYSGKGGTGGSTYRAENGDGLLELYERGDAIEALQKALNDKANAGLKADGDYGPKTEKAVTAYQKKNNLEVDGIAGPETLGHLGLRSGGNPKPSTPGRRAPDWPGVYLRNFTADSSVRTWQDRMRDRSWVNSSGRRLVVDGQYGTESERACRLFQGEKGLLVDGVVGPATWRATWEAPVT